MKQPQKLPLDSIFSKFPDAARQDKKQIYYREGIGVVMDISHFFQDVISLSSPYLIEDYRVGMVKRGELHGILNLQEYRFTEGTIVFLTPGTIVEPIGVSDDFQLEGMGLAADKFLLAHGGKVPRIFNGQVKDGYRIVTHEERMLVDSMFRMFINIMSTENMAEEVIYNMVATITHYYNQLFTNRTGSQPYSHATDIFNRFLRLVNLHGRREHQLSFYAEKLCITDRYLGTLVKQTSGVSAKEWIDRAIISAAKVMLRHSDRQGFQIADELNFPTASFFCKYFKRLTGMTPQQYRKE